MSRPHLHTWHALLCLLCCVCSVDESMVFDPTDLAEDVTPAATLKALGQVRRAVPGCACCAVPGCACCACYACCAGTGEAAATVGSWLGLQGRLRRDGLKLRGTGAGACWAGWAGLAGLAWLAGCGWDKAGWQLSCTCAAVARHEVPARAWGPPGCPASRTLILSASACPLILPSTAYLLVQGAHLKALLMAMRLNDPQLTQHVVLR